MQIPALDDPEVALWSLELIGKSDAHVKLKLQRSENMNFCL